MNIQTLYTELMALCQPIDSPFYYVDHRLGDNFYRVFTYRLAQYTDYLQASAKECRGHMFQIREDGTMVRLAAIPMHKFFNFEENPFTMGLDLSVGAELVMDKMDGSLISSFIDYPAKLRLKSKTALESDQANAAMNYLKTNEKLYNFVEVMTANDWTVNMEFTAPDDKMRIVLPYQEKNLTVLCLRNIKTGNYMPRGHILQTMTHWGCEQHLVADHKEKVGDLAEFLKKVPEMLDTIEGYVVVLNSGEWFKIKTLKYCALHNMKDSIGSQKRLFEAVVNEAADDAKAAFKDDAYIVSQIVEMEKKIADIYTEVKRNVIGFYNENKHLERKDFAIKGQNELKQMYFGLAMALYVGKEPNYKDWMLKHRKDFGIKDDPIALDE